MSLYFDRKKFATEYRKRFGALSQSQTDGLTFILNSAEKDPLLKSVEVLGYMLGTTKHETAHTFKPIHEYGGRAYFIKRYGSQTKVGRGLGNDTPEEGAIYAGRGDVQLTGEVNYEKAEEALRKFYPELIHDFELRTGKKFDLTVGDQANDQYDPDNAQDPAIAYAIMSYGMHKGMFTGRKITDYKLTTKEGRKSARAVINGDVAKNGQMIGETAREFTDILVASQVNTPQVSAADTYTPATQSPQTVEPVNPADPQNGQPPISDRVVIEDREKQGFFSTIWKKLTAKFGGDVTLAVATEKAKEMQLLGLDADTWRMIFYIGVVAGVVWLLFEAYKYYMRVTEQTAKTAMLVTANTTPTNRVEIANTDVLQEYRAKGYTVITR